MNGATTLPQEKPILSIEELELERRRKIAVRGHILFVFAILLALVLAWHLRQVLEIVYVSALFAVVLMPAVKQIMRLNIRGWRPSRPVAIVALVLSVFVFLACFFLIALPPVVHDMEHFTADLPARIPELVGRLKHVPLADKFSVDSVAQKSESMISSAAQYLFTSAPLWLSHIFDIFTALVLCIYFMLEGDHAYEYFLTFVPIESRKRLDKTLGIADLRMSKWLLGQGSLMLILGVCSTIVFAILHVRYFFLLGVLMGLFNIIPVAGGIITIVLVAIVAAIDSWTKVAGVLIFYAIYLQVENGFLTPRIMRSSVNLMGLSVLIALIAGTSLAGVVGALVAVPTAALIAVLMEEYMVQPDQQPPSQMVR
jgi:predicted PurR-regulated permease PerM